MNIKPIGERVLLKPIKIEEKTASGIILTSNLSNDLPNMAEVIEIGNLEKFKEIKVGKKVVYSKFSGTEIKDNDVKYIIINTEDILALID